MYLLRYIHIFPNLVSTSGNIPKIHFAELPKVLRRIFLDIINRVESLSFQDGFQFWKQKEVPWG